MEASTSSYINDDQGGKFIAASQRPDGSWRKPRRVKDGYVPQEEVPLYESKGKHFAKAKPQYPVGLSIDIINESKAKREKAIKCPIPGLVLDSSPETKSNKKKKKKKSVAEELTESVAKMQVTEPEPPQTDPVKRVKNLTKRLRGIEAIEQKIASGELKSLEKDQIDKVSRKLEVLREIKQLTKLIESK